MRDSNFSHSNNDTFLIKVDSLRNLEKGWEIRSWDKRTKERSILVGIISRGSKGKNFILRSCLENANIKHNEGIAFTDFPENHLSIVSSSGVRMPPSDENTSEMDLELIEEDNKETNNFIQRFIIWHSSMFIVVIGQMNASEFNFYHRVKYDCILRKNQKVFVIHNLKEFCRIEQVAKYIQTIIIGMLKLEIEYSFLFPSKDYLNYYIDRISNCDIIHLVLAKEGTEAGEYFNEAAFDLIGNNIQASTNSYEKGSICNLLKDYLVTQSSSLFVDSIEKDEIVISENKIKLVPKLQNGYLKNYQFKSSLNAHSNDKQLSFKGSRSYYCENDFLIFELFSPEKISIRASVISKNETFIFTFGGVYSSSGKEFQIQFEIYVFECFLADHKYHKLERKGDFVLIYYELQKPFLEEEEFI